MYVLCAAEWSFRAISYCFVHRRTSRFGSRFGSIRDFKNMVELFDCKMQEKAPKSTDFGAFYGGQYRTRTCDPMHVKSHPFVFFCILIIICSYFRRKSSVFTGDFLLCPSRFCPVWVTVWVRRKSPHVQHSEAPPSARSDRTAGNLHTAGTVPAAQRGQKP